ncbi:MAG: geranylgeranyl reductase family protein [Acidimicrobiales bacterium]
MSQHVHDVIVVGSGPAGIAAALTLVDGGADVLVIDKAQFPRDKTCGDGLTTLALRELEALGLAPGAVASWTPIDTAFLHAPSRRVVELPLPQGPGQFAAVARRVDLDAALVDLARDRGVTIAESTSLASVRQRIDHVELDTTGAGTVHARWAIGADGMWSPLRRHLGLAEPGYRGEWHAFRQYIRTASVAARDLHVWFEPDILPGYAWSFPLTDDVVNVGFGVLRGERLDGKAMARLWDDLLTRPAIADVLGPDAVPEGPHRAWPIPAAVTSTSLAVGRTLFVGDAARATDVFTGEGIGQALLTGRLAAEAILDAPPGDPLARAAAVTDSYTRVVRHHLAPDHRMATALSWIMTDPHLGNGAIAVVGATDWTRRNVARWLFEDSPRGIALTPRRWRRGALSGPPAYAGST